MHQKILISVLKLQVFTMQRKATEEELKGASRTSCSYLSCLEEEELVSDAGQRSRRPAARRSRCSHLQTCVCISDLAVMQSHFVGAELQDVSETMIHGLNSLQKRQPVTDPQLTI